MNKFLTIAGAVALTLPAIANAGNTITFDPDGAGSLAAVQIDTFDWKPGNAVALGGANLITNPTTQLLYQANLNTADRNSLTQVVSGFGGASYLTAVAGFRETATVTNGGNTANFSLVPSGSTAPTSTNFFYIYATNAPGDNLAGTGFTSGTLILQGYVSKLSSSNFNNTPGATDLFDKFGADNYAGKQSVVGSGSTDITVTITSANQTYFPGLALSGLTFSFFNNSQITPFTTVDPSRNFDLDGLAGGTQVAPVLGAVNGFSGGGGNDFQFLADANQAFLVPEPGSLALVGIALAGLGFAGRRRRS